MTYPIRPDLHTFNGFVPTTEILREEWGPSGDLDDLRRSFDGRHRRRPRDHRRDHVGADHADLLPRPAAGVGHRPDRPLGDAAHPTPPSAGQGAGAGARGLRDARGVPAPRGRPGRRAGGARRVRRTPPGADRGHAHRRADNFAMFNEPDPVQMRARDGRLQRHAAHGSGRRDDVRLALRPRRDRRRRGAARRRRRRRRRPWRRPEAQRAYELWSGAIALEDRARLWVGEREGYERFLRRGLPAARRRRRADLVACDGVPALRVTPPGGAATSDPSCCTSTAAATRWARPAAPSPRARRLAAAVGGWALVPDYRLAPEHAFPAALDDVARRLSLARARARARPHRASAASAPAADSPSRWRCGCATPASRSRPRCTSCRRSAT